MQLPIDRKPPQSSLRIVGIDGARHNSTQPKLVRTGRPVKTLSAQAAEWMVDAGGRRYRPAVIKVLQNAELVKRQVEERRGDIVGVARIHRVGCNDIGLALVIAGEAA